MKLMIASDLHGSAYYGEKLLKRFEEEGAEKLILLGDLLYHGPRNDYPEKYDTKALFARLNEVREKLVCVRGNCDCEVDQMVLEFPIMAKHCMLFVDGHTIMATHGHEFNIGCLPPLAEGDILLYGHFHEPLCETRNGILCLNPGSCALPKNGSPNSYMTYEDGSFLWKDMDGAVFMTHTL